jgi:hypothetical protein
VRELTPAEEEIVDSKPTKTELTQLMERELTPAENEGVVYSGERGS